jgi:hypothetical protein
MRLTKIISFASAHLNMKFQLPAVGRSGSTHALDFAPFAMEPGLYLPFLARPNEVQYHSPLVEVVGHPS